MILTPEIRALLLIVANDASLDGNGAAEAWQHPEDANIQFYYYPKGSYQGVSIEYVSVWTSLNDFHIYNSQEMMRFIEEKFITN